MEQIAGMPQRFRALDAWRGLCAILVVLFHVPILHAAKDMPALANLQLCVDFFFVLSGFVISHAYQRRLGGEAAVGAFLAARFLRLWPLHVVVLSGFVLLETAKFAYGFVNPAFGMDAAPFSTGKLPSEILTNLLFLQSFGLNAGLSWNVPAWSIAVEFWVSLVFAAVIVWAPAERAKAFLLIGLVAANVLMLVSPGTLFVSHDWGFARCLLGFSAGCIVYDIRQRFPAPRLPFALIEPLAVGVAAAFILLTRQGPGHLAAPLVFGLVVYVFSFERGALSRGLRAGPLQALGRWSFSIYMTHALLFQVMRTAGSFVAQKFGWAAVAFHGGDKILTFGTGASSVAAVALAIAGSVLLGALACRFVETPLARLPLPLLRGPAPARLAAR